MIEVWLQERLLVLRTVAVRRRRRQQVQHTFKMNRFYNYKNIN
jgi:hypothetical protein